jgi:hypothetical protein
VFCLVQCTDCPGGSVFSLVQCTDCPGGSVFYLVQCTDSPGGSVFSLVQCTDCPVCGVLWLFSVTADKYCNVLILSYLSTLNDPCIRHNVLKHSVQDGLSRFAFVRFQALKTASLKMAVFWVVAPRSLVDDN